MQGSTRIALNTVILYIKLILTVILGLYISRVVLGALGASDYGLYVVVGGIVSLFNVLGTTMVTVSYRFMSVEIGKGNNGAPNRTYNAILLIHILLAAFLLIVGSIVGRWYVINYLNVAEGKIDDALFVLYLSLISAAITVISVPSNGLLIAREKFLFTSLVELTQRILVVIFLVTLLEPFEGNKLRMYAIGIAFLNALIPISYVTYCKIKEKEIVRYRLNRKKDDYKGVFKFTVWTLLSTISYVVNIQGLSMVVNFFFGTAINASLGLANTVKNYAKQFVGTIKQASVPQIMQSYSAGNTGKSYSLTFRMTKYTFYVMLLVMVPIIASMDGLLQLWLHEVPEGTNILAILLLISCLVENFGSPSLGILLQASGNIKMNEIIYSITKILLIPIAIVLYKLGYPVYIAPLIDIVLTLITCVLQIWNATRVIDFSFRDYFTYSIWPSIRPLLLIIPVFLIKRPVNHSLVNLLFSVGVVVIWSGFSIWLVGLDKDERNRIITIVNNRIHK